MNREDILPLKNPNVCSIPAFSPIFSSLLEVKEEIKSYDQIFWHSSQSYGQYMSHTIYFSALVGGKWQSNARAGRTIVKKVTEVPR